MSAIRWIACGLVCTLATGCHRNGSNDAYDPCDASGLVTIDGMPAPSGMVTYLPTIPESAGGHPGIASIDSAGRYHLGNAEHGRAKLLPPGEYIVTVVAMDINHSKGPPAPKLSIPERYANFAETPLHVTLKPGDNKVDLEIVR